MISEGIKQHHQTSYLVPAMSLLLLFSVGLMVSTLPDALAKASAGSSSTNLYDAHGLRSRTGMASNISTSAHSLVPLSTPTCVSGLNYTIITSTGATLDPGTTDIGLHCMDCMTGVGLPFPIHLYGQTFTYADVSSHGNLQFLPRPTKNGQYANTCLPDPSFGSTIFAHWDDVFNVTGGVFISTRGSAPNRVFNIEWRVIYADSNHQNADFEVRLFEGQDTFDVVFSRVDEGGRGATVGVQGYTGNLLTLYECNTTNSLSNSLKLTFIPPCTPTPPTPVVTYTSTPVPTCGTAWRTVSSPGSGPGDNYLTSVTAVSANDTWAVGYYQDAQTFNNQTLTEHWDGSQWSIMTSPNLGTGDNYLAGVSAVSASNVWAVGYYYNGSLNQDQYNAPIYSDSRLR